MEGAVRASTPAMGASIRRLLEGLHKEKGAPGVDAMLLRLYEPIIFRCDVVQTGFKGCKRCSENPDVHYLGFHGTNSMQAWGCVKHLF